MSNLFIIGNGFDLAHSLPTSYEDFHQYLICNYPEADKESPTFTIESTMTPNGEEIYSEEDVVSFLIDIISITEQDGDNWSDIETSLGQLNFDEYLGEMASLLDNDEDDDDLWKRVYRNEDASEHFYQVTVNITDYFSEWINLVDISEAQPRKKFEELIDINNDIFLTFNYTTLLEDLYESEFVFHIHGTQGGEIIIGHGIFNKEIETKYIGAEHALYRIRESLKKDTDTIISNSGFFFNELTSVKKIYSYGFSFSEVDLPYIKEIINRVNTEEVTWYLSDFESEKIRDKYKETIKSCGFKGTFEIFNI